VLRLVAHEISADPERPDRPVSARAAKAGLDRLIRKLQRETPRFGLSAANAAFVDHVAGVAERYGSLIFTCFDHPRLPPTTNDIERYFGATKAQLRHALGAASTAGGVAHNLGADYLGAFAVAWLHPGEKLLDLIEDRTNDYARARGDVDDAERSARLRRSRLRDPERHIFELLSRWHAGP
jgi:hypothetical protein